MKPYDKSVPEPEVNDFSLRSFLLKCLSQWKWILVSLICFIGIGFLLIYTKQPVFNRSINILVKDQESAGGVSDLSNSFSQMGLVSSNTKVLNELISFTSPAVMYEVVKRLDLTMNYNLKKGMHPNTLWGTNNPIDVKFLDLSENGFAGFTIVLNPDGSYVIENSWILEKGKKNKFKEKIQGRLDDDSIRTPMGYVSIKRNPDYAGEPVSEPMTIEVRQVGLPHTVEAYLKALQGDLVDQDADVIELSIDNVSVERADRILETVVEVYNERWIEDKNKVAIATSNFITERLKVIEGELDVFDDEIAKYKSEVKVPDFAEMAKGYMEQDFKMSDDVTTVTNMIAMATFLKEYIDNPENNFKIIPMNTGIENPMLEEQIGYYNTRLLERNNLLGNSSLQNPIIKNMDRELVGLRSAIKQSVNANIANLKNSLANLNKAQKKAKDEMGGSPRQAQVILSAERQQQVVQELYLFLLQKREETELTQKFTADNIRVITPPYGPYKPVAPKKKLIMMVMVFLGIALPVGIIFLNESLNNKIRSKKDLENTPVPFAGELPYIGKKKRFKKLLQSKKQRQKDIDRPLIVVKEGERDIPNEAFRVVRSNIDFMLDKNTPCTLLALTSFNPGSGKSFVAYNLGRSFELKGKKVLLIDGDLRHGSLSVYVNSPRKGLSTYLTGANEDWQSLVVADSEMPGLHILPIGHKPPNPAELLESPKLAKLFEEVKKHFDIVLVDCPPVNIVVDTQLINQYVDRTIFVVRAGVLEKTAVKDLNELYTEHKLKGMSLLLNGTSAEFSSYHTYGNYEAVDK